MVKIQLLLLSLTCILPTNAVLEEFTSTAFDNYHLECAKSSGVKKMSISLVGSQGALRRDIVFSFSCQRINTMFPWIDIPEGVAEIEREDCYYSSFIDPLVDEDTPASCGKREYIAGITRLSTTKVQFLCCRLRTKDEANCTEKNFSKPSDLEPKTEISLQKMVVNAISIKDDKYTVRFCEMQPRDIDTLIKDVGTTKHTRTYPRTTLSTSAATTTMTTAETTTTTTTMATTTTTMTTQTATTTAFSTTLSNETGAAVTTDVAPTTGKVETLLQQVQEMLNNGTEQGNEITDEIRPITFQPAEARPQEERDIISQKIDMPPESFLLTTMQTTVEDAEAKSGNFSVKPEELLITEVNDTNTDGNKLMKEKNLISEINEQTTTPKSKETNETYGVDLPELKRLEISELGKTIRRKQPSSSSRRRATDLTDTWNEGKHHSEIGNLKKHMTRKSSRKHKSSRVASTISTVSVTTEAVTATTEPTTIYRRTTRARRLPSSHRRTASRKTQTIITIPTTRTTSMSPSTSPSTTPTTPKPTTTTTSRPITQRFTATKLLQKSTVVTQKPMTTTTAKPKIMVFTKAKNHKLQQVKRFKQSEPISAVIAVKPEPVQKQSTKKVFKNFGNNYSQVVSSTLHNQNKTNVTSSTVRNIESVNQISSKPRPSAIQGSERWLRDDALPSMNSIARSWSFDNVDLLSSLRRKHQPNFYKTAQPGKEQKKLEPREIFLDTTLPPLSDGSVSGFSDTAAATTETNELRKSNFYGRLKDGIRTFKANFEKPLVIPDNSLYKEKNKKYFGKKPAKSDNDVWNLNIFDDLESYSVDMPPESFSPGTIRDELVSMSASTDDEISKTSTDETQHLSAVSHREGPIKSTNDSITESSVAAKTNNQTTTISSIPHDPAKFYHTPSPKRPPGREKILTFCTKDIAVRDLNNLVIACGDDFEVWRPRRCPEKSDCFFSKDSTYRICCPVAETASSMMMHFNRFS